MDFVAGAPWPLHPPYAKCAYGRIKAMKREPVDSQLSREEAERLEQLKINLDEAGIAYEILAHAETIYSPQDGVKSGMGSLAEMTPTFILVTEKGLLAAIVSGATRLVYKKIKKELGLKNVSLASPEVVLRATGAQVGTVSLVNRGMPTIVDSGVLDLNRVYGGCGVPRHTLRMRPEDLVRATGGKVFEFAEEKDQAREKHPLPPPSPKITKT